MDRALDGDGIRLLQLHGSIDWVRDPSFGARMRMSDDAGANHDPAILFGGSNKMTAEAPFLDLMRQFKSVVEQADVVTTIGYSFRDHHVNEIIDSWRRWNLHPEIQGDCRLEILDNEPSEAILQRAQAPKVKLIEGGCSRWSWPGVRHPRVLKIAGARGQSRGHRRDFTGPILDRSAA